MILEPLEAVVMLSVVAQPVEFEVVGSKDMQDIVEFQRLDLDMVTLEDNPDVVDNNSKLEVVEQQLVLGVHQVFLSKRLMNLKFTYWSQSFATKR